MTQKSEIKTEQDQFTRSWIIQNALEEIQNYEAGVLTLRALHYRLVSRGMTNSLQHYKRVVAAMTAARWSGQVRFNTFSDLDREMVGFTAYSTTDLEWEISYGQDQVKAWMNHYSKNRWENQEYYPEVLIEKKALQGVFSRPCRDLDVAIGACKGYPSLTFLNDLRMRVQDAQEAGKKVVILYFGDYDPSGEDIPRSIGENLERMGIQGVEIRRILLMEHQVLEWGLPPAPAKITDSRTVNWDGLGQVELDAVEPKKLQGMVTDAIMDLFDEDKYQELKQEEAEEKETYKSRLREFVNNL